MHFSARRNYNITVKFRYAVKINVKWNRSTHFFLSSIMQEERTGCFVVKEIRENIPELFLHNKTAFLIAISFSFYESFHKH